MFKHIRKTWLLALAVAVTGVAVANDKVVRIATGELAPYATESRPDGGMALAIVRAAFELSGHKVEYNFRPWSRALAEARAGKWDGTAYWGHKPEYDTQFYLSDNVLTEQWVMVYRKELGLKWSMLTDLRPYRMAIISDYTYTPELWALIKAGTIKTESAPNDAGVLKLLLLGRADVAPMELSVACELLKTQFTEADFQKLAADPKLMAESFTTHLMMNRTQSDNANTLADFNAGLKKLRESGEYARLLEKSPCPESWRRH
jgi:polar amino acid transport system substrate-binding protein